MAHEGTSHAKRYCMSAARRLAHIAGAAKPTRMDAGKNVGEKENEIISRWPTVTFLSGCDLANVSWPHRLEGKRRRPCARRWRLAKASTKIERGK